MSRNIYELHKVVKDPAKGSFFGIFWVNNMMKKYETSSS